MAAGLAGLGLLFSAAIAVGYFVLSPTSGAAAQDAATLRANNAVPIATTTTRATSTTSQPQAISTPLTQPSTTVPAPEPDLIELYEVSVIGDSLVVEADKQLRAALAPARVQILGEAAVSLGGAQQTIEQLGEQLAQSDIVVVALGSADFDLPEGYDLMIRGALSNLSGAHCVIWVDAQELSGNLPEVNDAIKSQVERFPSAFVAPWSSIAGNPGFHPDTSYHLNDRGANAFASLVSSAVRENCLER